MFGTRKQAKLRNIQGNYYQPKIEVLESRVVPYATTGDIWPHAEVITISFVPDGTNLGGVTSNLFATFNAKFGSPKVWQAFFLKAAQQWAAQTNINFSVITDGGAPSGSGEFQQGDPTMGDIRIGGYNFRNSRALAAANFSPTANNYSVGGDVTFNTGLAWNNGSDYDVTTVAMHEIGHALGLEHSSSAATSMYSAYTGKKAGLNADDIAGIRSIYSAGSVRAKDGFDAVQSNGTFAAAASISLDEASNTALVTNLNITATSDVDFFKFTAPLDSSSSLTLTVQSSGLSLLAPKVWVYNGSQTQLATVSGAGQYGTTLQLTVPNITPGVTYFVKVAGADATAFGTGGYALTLNLGSDASPTVPLPNTTTANGTPLHSGGGLANQTLLGVLLNPVLGLLFTDGIFGGYGDLFEVEDQTDYASPAADFAQPYGDLAHDWTASLFADEWDIDPLPSVNGGGQEGRASKQSFAMGTSLAVRSSEKRPDPMGATSSFGTSDDDSEAAEDGVGETEAGEAESAPANEAPPAS